MKKKQTAGAAFLPLFSLEISHQYLSGGAYGAFAPTALGATQKVLQRFGWACAQMENKFTLYADRVRAAAVLKQGAGVPLNSPDLCFALEFRDADFARYTHLPMQAGSTLSLVGGEAQPSDLAEALVPVHSRSFQCPVSAGSEPEDLWVVNLSGEKVLRFPAPFLGTVTIDPAVLDVGLYNVIYKKKIIYKFIKAIESFNLIPVFALSISVKQMLEIIQDLLENTEPPEEEFEVAASCSLLTLPTRSTLWRYDLFNHGGADAKDFSIQPVTVARSGSHAATLPAFQPVDGLVGPGGELSLAFQSVSPIPLTAQPGGRLTLLRHKKPLIDELPTPGLDFCQAQDRNELCSNLFIHL